MQTFFFSSFFFFSQSIFLASTLSDPDSNILFCSNPHSSDTALDFNPTDVAYITTALKSQDSKVYWELSAHFDRETSSGEALSSCLASLQIELDGTSISVRPPCIHRNGANLQSRSSP